MRSKLPLGLAGRVFLGTAVIVTTVLAAALVVTTASLRRVDEAAARRRLEQDADLVAHLLAGRERSLAGGARVFVQGGQFRKIALNPRREDILDQTFEAADLLGADWVFVTDARGRVIAKSDEPAAWGTDLGGVPLIAGALRGQTTAGFGVSRDTLLFQAVAVPIVVPGSAPVGVLVATRVVDREVVRDVRLETGSDVLFYTLGISEGGESAAAHARVAASSLPRGPSLDSALAAVANGAPRGRPPLRVGGATYLVQGATATTAGGDAVGGWAVLRGRDATAPAVAGMRESLLVAGLVGLGLALAAAWVAARRVTRPVLAMAEAARRAADGDYDGAAPAATSTVDATRLVPTDGDEIATLGVAFNAMLADLRDREALAAIGAATAVVAVPIEPKAPAPVPAPVPAPALTLARGRTPRTAARAVPRLEPVGETTVTRELLAERYELQAVVGSGGTGIVYRALDHALGELVAVKTLRPELLAADPLARERLTHEVRLARRISHRNVVRTHDLAEADGVPFLTMEYVDGPSLATLLRTHAGGEGRALPPRATLAVAKQLARALEVAHEQGVLHGDLKPANLLVAPGGVLKVTDFGVARLVRAVPTMAHAAGGRDAARLVGAIVGTPEYMAPELLLGGVPDVRADIYAAGVVLHECLTGTTPFSADTPVAFFAHKLDDAPAGAPTPAPRRAAPTRATAPLSGLAAVLETLAQQMVDADPAARPASARELHALLSRLG